MPEVMLSWDVGNDDGWEKRNCLPVGDTARTWGFLRSIPGVMNVEEIKAGEKKDTVNGLSSRGCVSLSMDAHQKKDPH